MNGSGRSRRDRGRTALPIPEPKPEIITTNVFTDYKPGAPSAFTGKIVKVTVEQR